ncbi:unnamed protein product [Sphagnum balticum]
MSVLCVLYFAVLGVHAPRGGGGVGGGRGSSGARTTSASRTSSRSSGTHSTPHVSYTVYTETRTRYARITCPVCTVHRYTSFTSYAIPIIIVGHAHPYYTTRPGQPPMMVSVCARTYGAPHIGRTGVQRNNRLGTNRIDEQDKCNIDQGRSIGGTTIKFKCSREYILDNILDVSWRWARVCRLVFTGATTTTRVTLTASNVILLSTQLRG